MLPERLLNFTKFRRSQGGLERNKGALMALPSVPEHALSIPQNANEYLGRLGLPTLHRYVVNSEQQAHVSESARQLVLSSPITRLSHIEGGTIGSHLAEPLSLRRVVSNVGMRVNLGLSAAASPLGSFAIDPDSIPPNTVDIASSISVGTDWRDTNTITVIEADGSLYWKDSGYGNLGNTRTVTVEVGINADGVVDPLFVNNDEDQILNLQTARSIGEKVLGDTSTQYTSMDGPAEVAFTNSATGDCLKIDLTGYVTYTQTQAREFTNSRTAAASLPKFDELVQADTQDEVMKALVGGLHSIVGAEDVTSGGFHQSMLENRRIADIDQYDLLREEQREALKLLASLVRMTIAPGGELDESLMNISGISEMEDPDSTLDSRRKSLIRRVNDALFEIFVN
ncbi:MAG TPA: hypothetical protein VLF93_02625 [Candidatus Saccharimonadales bacterium]|nr:hypothetical protein [Candidatus Saccharimonadales bacterium]